MDLLAKQQVIDFGKRLVENKLIARTWGNVSCRIDDKSFVITPSGRQYDSLTPGDIVKVDIETLKHEGSIKPSSEKGVHAEVYKHYKNAGFVIHTHQTNASVISALGQDINKVCEEYKSCTGYEIPVCEYGLPGTKKLMQNVADVLKRSTANALIMKHHGALCYGRDGEQALKSAISLESECASCLESLVCDDKPVEPCYNSKRDGDFAVLTSVSSDEEIRVNIKSPGCSLPKTAKAHIDIYSKRNDINYIVHSTNSYTVKVSKQCREMKPYLDDFAQIAGISARCVSNEEFVKAMHRRHALLIKDNGALCCGISLDDANAVKAILDKNSMARLAVFQFEIGAPIKPFDCLLMRAVYMKKYSKQTEKNK